ncbi:hypothetical protein [Paenibacillus hexagrammi]|uniref:Uncharacterized protein n=1 Tax=Paenibacillus hexagrammi TaxID=2908839 RepID=A0ABY3SPT2_9BACL|nr:hypothetical protein [Paenibacillus sp. YPD9-1]UJF35400.1 hypothetical protein L0M14_10015 [Paenibacillus sp. YPD9-1]
MLLRKSAVCALMLGLLLTGCGNRGMPVIKQEIMDKKISVLMLSSPALSNQAKQSIGKALLEWRNNQAITFEWLKDLAGIG